MEQLLDDVDLEFFQDNMEEVLMDTDDLSLAWAEACSTESQEDMSKPKTAQNALHTHACTHTEVLISGSVLSFRYAVVSCRVWRQFPAVHPNHPLPCPPWCGTAATQVATCIQRLHCFACADKPLMLG